jgi:signal transduction histidine kinase/CheY-like chemotaxis protein/HPt (histidine-containing phosphotransfer) domain-containing protein
MATRGTPAAPAAQGTTTQPRLIGTLSGRFTRLVMSAAFLAVLILLGTMLVQVVTTHHADLLAQARRAIDAQREAATSALLTEDRARARAVAQAVGIAAGASSVELRDLGGKVVARYAPTAEQAAAARGETGGGEQFALRYVPDLALPGRLLRQPVDINGDPLGTLEVAIPGEAALVRGLHYLQAALLAIIAIAVVTWLLVLRINRQVSVPIIHLLEMMDFVATKQDYSVRATPAGPNEIRSLIVSFNEMLREIHTRNQRLADHRRKLQELVIERTRSFERAADEAERASRAKGDFLARMSHEIRTPMNGVVGMAELLENTRLEEQQHSMLKTMRSSADSLLSIINDILDFSRIEAGQLQVLETDFSPLELIEEICELLAPRAHERGLELICDVDGTVPATVAGDPIRVRQIITNLLGNAVKYTEKGRIWLRASARPGADGKVSVKVTVEDTGFGIAESQLESIFEAFTQGDSFETRKHGGTGLGLAITKQLVSVLGGDIGVESTLGAGSTFWVDIPLTLREADAAAPVCPPGVRNVLLVEEDDTAARALARLLEAQDVRVWTAQTAHRALGQLEINDADLVILDDVLPDMSGYALIEKLRADSSRASLPVIMLTSTKPAAEKVHAESQLSMQPDAMLARPVRRRVLRDAFDEALGRKQAGTGAARATPDRQERLGLRILLVEDSPVNCEVAVGMLEALGCKVETAADGSIGLELALSWGFDAILMDCQMPLMDGFEATRRIRAAEAEGGREPVPIVALTANALQGDRERCLEAGMSDFISKPFTMKRLHEALRSVTTRGADGRLAPAPTVVAAAAAQEPASGGLPVVDMAHINELRALGKPNIIHQAVTLFQKQALQSLTELENALKEGRAADVERAAHSLKSASLSVGGRRFAAVAGACEEAAREEDIEKAGLAAAELRPRFAMLCQALGELRQTDVAA